MNIIEEALTRLMKSIDTEKVSKVDIAYGGPFDGEGSASEIVVKISLGS